MTIPACTSPTAKQSFARSRPRILFILDLPNWAHDFKTENIRKVLGDDYDIRKKYQADVTREDLDRADLIVAYYWLQIDRMKHLNAALEQNQGKLLVGICSHWEVTGRFRKAALATLRKWARGVFVNNLSLFEEFESAFDVPVFCTPNGVDTEFYSPAPRAETSSRLRVGWAGSLSNREPGQRRFNELIAPAVNSLAGTELVSAVREERWRTPPEMREFYRSLDVYVCASKSEGTPNPCLEAAACGIPVVSTAVGNMPELIRHGQNGFLIQPNIKDLRDKLQGLHDSPELRFSMGRQIRKDIQLWDWTINAREYSAMFKEALSRTSWQRRVVKESAPAITQLVPYRSSNPLALVRSRLLKLARNNLSYLPASFFARQREDKLTLLLLSHGRLELTLNAIRAICENVSIPFKLLLIDNGSDPAVQTRLTEFCSGLDNARLILLNENRGCAGGRIYGLTQVETEYVMFVDNDVEILPGAVEHLLHSLESNSRLIAAMARVVFPNGSIQLAGANYRVKRGVLFYELHHAHKPFGRRAHSSNSHCKWVSGTATIFRRAALKRYPVEGSMRAYYEDLEWCFRVNQSEPKSFCANNHALALHYYRSKLPPQFLTEAERRNHSAPYIETIARFYKLHGLIIHSLFTFVPELGHPSHGKSIRAAQAFLDLVNLKGTNRAVEQWNNGELEALFHRKSLQVRFIKTSRAAARILRAATVGRLG